MQLRSGILTIITILIVLSTLAWQQVERKTGPRRFWIKVVFGMDGKPASWDGNVSIEKGKIFRMVDWCLEERDKLNTEAFSWNITTGIPAKRRVTFAEPMRGVLLEVEASDKTRLRVKTAQGNFDIQPTSLIPGRPKSILDGRVTVEPLGTSTLVVKSNTDDDFASIAVDDKDHRHVLWIAFDEKDKTNRLLIRDVDEPGSKPQSLSTAREFASAHLFNTKAGLRVVYCSPGNGTDWDVYTSLRTNNGWQTKQVTSAKGTDFQLAAAQGDDGSLWITWQSFRNGNGDIFAQCLRKGKWLDKDIPVSTSPANEWQPAISVDAQGHAWIGYDSYENGNYDVFLTSLQLNQGACKQGPRIAIAQSQDFEAHASVLADSSGRIWVAYDAAGPNWGRDFHNTPTTVNNRYAEPLHASRRLGLRCVKNGKVYQPGAALPQQLPPRPIKAIARNAKTKPSRFYEFPQLARDGNGRIWLLFRQCRQGYCPHPPRGIDWSIYATTYTNKGWLEPIQLPKSQGRQNQRVAFAIGPDQRLHCAWADGCRFASVNRKYGVYFGSLPTIAENKADIPLKLAPRQLPGTAKPSPPVPWTITREGKTYRLYYGDLHRHTNISRCSPTVDGCLTDAHRYALDAAELDFLGITDHTRDVDPFSWWRTQQAADQFHIPGRYVPIYAYERSNGTTMGGHRNVFFLKRGWEVNPSDHWFLGRGLQVKDTNPDTTLYPWLKKKGGALTAAHTPAYAKGVMKGTWTYNDPQVEPVAEIFQGFRRDYERPGAGVAEQASLWHALQKGHKLGFIASSDHISTHSSYACIWATEKSREALFEGLSARRTFAATDRIVLFTRIGNALMGEETKVDGTIIKLNIKAVGTTPIDEIQIVRNGQVISRLQPGKANIDMMYTDKNPPIGEAYYYVRLHQRNGARAWSSPIWVKR